MNHKTIIKIITNKSLKKYQKLSKILKYLFVKLAKISQKEYLILGSFAIRKERIISDLDINLEYNEFFKLKTLLDMNYGVLQIYNNQIRWFFDLTDLYNKLTAENEADFSIEAFQVQSTFGFPNKNFSLKKLSKNGLDVDENGHQFFTLKTLLKWKKTMNRPKDQADIEIIKKLLMKQ